MKPEETIIMSDSTAYDFEPSAIFYANENGESVRLTATFHAISKTYKRWNREALSRSGQFEIKNMKRSAIPPRNYRF